MAMHSIWMFFFASALFLLGAAWQDYVTYYVGFVVQSFGGILGIVVSTQVADVIPNPDQRGLIVGLYTAISVLFGVIATVIANVAVIAMNPVDYSEPASVLFIISCLVVIGVFVIFPETLSVKEVPFSTCCCFPRLARSASLQARASWAPNKPRSQASAFSIAIASVTMCHWRADEQGEDSGLVQDVEGGGEVELHGGDVEDGEAGDERVSHVASSPRVYGTVVRDPVLEAQRKEGDASADPLTAVLPSSSSSSSTSGHHRPHDEDGEGDEGDVEAEDEISPNRGRGRRWAKAREWSWWFLVPCQGCSILCEDGLIGSIGVVVGVAMLAGTSLTVLQAFVTHAYKWTNAESTWGGVAVLVIFLLSVSCSSCITRAVGSINAMQVGFGLVTLGFFILIAAPIHPAVGMAGTIIIASGGFLIAPLAVLLTRVVPRERQGQFQTVLNSLALGVAAPAAVLYSVLFAADVPLKEVVRPCFAIGFAFMVATIILAYRTKVIYKHRIKAAFGED